MCVPTCVYVCESQLACVLVCACVCWHVDMVMWLLCGVLL